MTGSALLLAAARESARALAKGLLAALNSPNDQSVALPLPHPFSNMSREDWRDAVHLWRTHARSLLSTLPHRPCPACGEEDADFLFESYDAYPYVECRACGSWRVPLHVDASVFQRYFEIAPSARRYGDYTQAQITNEAAAASDRLRFGEYYSEISTLLGPARRTTLDIGCGTGNSLAVASQLGFVAHGVEVNNTALVAARARGLVVDSPESAPRTAAYDSVTFWETIEHLADPLAALTLARQRLSSGGVVVVSAPNLNSPAIRAMRGDSLQIHGGPAWPGHINLYTRETLSILMRRAGFEPVYVYGQFSMSLAEVVAYSSGCWRGARAYLGSDEPVARLPLAARTLIEAFGPLVSAFEEAAAFAPILVMVAKRSGDADPPGLAELRAQRLSRVAASLEAAFGEVRPTAPSRGVRLSFDSAFVDEGFAATGATARYQATPPSPYAYIWKSKPLRLAAGETVRLRGKTFVGRLTFGVLSRGAWNAQTPIDGGAFDVGVTASEDAEYEIVIANCAGGSTDADFDALERVGKFIA